MNICEFYYIRRRDNLPIQTKGIEKTWSELQKEFSRHGPGYPGATYYKTISSEGPDLFAVVNKKWVLFHENGKWHRYITACDIQIKTLSDNKSDSKPPNDEHEDDSWVVISDKEYDVQIIDN